MFHTLTSTILAQLAFALPNFAWLIYIIRCAEYWGLNGVKSADTGPRLPRLGASPAWNLPVSRFELTKQSMASLLNTYRSCGFSPRCFVCPSEDTFPRWISAWLWMNGT